MKIIFFLYGKYVVCYLFKFHLVDRVFLNKEVCFLTSIYLRFVFLFLLILLIMAPGLLIVSWGLSYSYENEARVRVILIERFHRPYFLNVFTVETPYNIITRVMFLKVAPADSDAPADLVSPADLDILVENNRNLHHLLEFILECFWPRANDFQEYMFMNDL